MVPHVRWRGEKTGAPEGRREGGTCPEKHMCGGVPERAVVVVMVVVVEVGRGESRIPCAPRAVVAVVARPTRRARGRRPPGHAPPVYPEASHRRPTGLPDP